MTSANRPIVISGAWPNILAEFVRGVSNELLVMSPWITTVAAKLIANNLAHSGPVRLQLLARLDVADFLSGSSHIAAFLGETYPSGTDLRLRALPMLHAKMVIGDRSRVIVGSANMTESGLCRNHEVCLLLNSTEVAKECADVFFRFWEFGSDVPIDYLKQMEQQLRELQPRSDDESDDPPRPRMPRRRKTGSSFKYVRPSGAGSALRQLAELLLVSPVACPEPERIESAINWLTRQQKFLTKEQRGDEVVLKRIERLMYHPDIRVRATAVDRAGRSGNRYFLSRLLAIVSNPTEDAAVRSAAAFSLGLIGAPEAFSVLVPIADGEADVNRWARRSCFLLLGSVDAENQESFLHELGIADHAMVSELLRASDVSSGTVSERLTKGLLIEKLATGKWGREELDKLVVILKALSIGMAAGKKHPQLGQITKLLAEALSIAQGDLRHGPLSPSLLRRFSEPSLLDSGLKALIDQSLVEVTKNEALLRTSLETDTKFVAVMRLVDL